MAKRKKTTRAAAAIWSMADAFVASRSPKSQKRSKLRHKRRGAGMKVHGTVLTTKLRVAGSKKPKKIFRFQLKQNPAEGLQWDMIKAYRAAQGKKFARRKTKPKYTPRKITGTMLVTRTPAIGQGRGRKKKPGKRVIRMEVRSNGDTAKERAKAAKAKKSADAAVKATTKAAHAESPKAVGLTAAAGIEATQSGIDALTSRVTKLEGRVTSVERAGDRIRETVAAIRQVVGSTKKGRKGLQKGVSKRLEAVRRGQNDPWFHTARAAHRDQMAARKAMETGKAKSSHKIESIPFDASSMLDY